MDLPDALDAGPQLGPFPLGVWVVLGAGGVGIGLIIRRRNAGRDAAAASSFATEQARIAQLSGTSPGGAGTGSASTSSTTSAAPAIESNAAWRTAAIRALIDAGVSPLTAEQAIGRYLTGQDLTDAQGQALSMALTQIGPPPEYVAPSNVLPPANQNTPNPVGGYPQPQPPLPAAVDVGTLANATTTISQATELPRSGPVVAAGATPQPVPPQPAPSPEQAAQPQFRTHTVMPGDTLWGIAQQYLGDGSRWTEVADYTNFFRGLDNQAPIDPYNLQPGTRIAVRVA